MKVLLLILVALVSVVHGQSAHAIQEKNLTISKLRAEVASLKRELAEVREGVDNHFQFLNLLRSCLLRRVVYSPGSLTSREAQPHGTRRNLSDY
jgi:hypothetical protein